MGEKDIELAEAARIANEEHLSAERAINDSLEHARAAGEALLSAKRLLSHGDWTPWVEKNFAASVRTARVYMRIASRWHEIEQKRQTSAVLSIDAAIKFLASVDAQEPGADESMEVPGGIVVRDALLKHFERLHLGGAVADARIERDYSSAALDPKGQVLAVVPRLAEVEPLAGPVGITDLGLLIRVLKSRSQEPGVRSPNIKLTARSNCVRVFCDDVASVDIQTHATIGSEVKRETVEKLCRVFEAPPLFDVGESVIEWYLYLRRAMAANRAEISAREDVPGGGGQIRLWCADDGKGSHVASLRFRAKYHPCAPIQVDAQLLAAVFEQMKDCCFSSEATVSDGVLGVKHLDGHRYVLSGYVD